MKENKSNERTRMEELGDFFFFLVYLSVDTLSSFFSFFLKLAIFSTSLLQEEKSNRFSKELIPAEPLQSSKPLKRPA